MHYPDNDVLRKGTEGKYTTTLHVLNTTFFSF